MQYQMPQLKLAVVMALCQCHSPALPLLSHYAAECTKCSPAVTCLITSLTCSPNFHGLNRCMLGAVRLEPVTQCFVQSNIQVVPSIAASLLGQQSLSSLASPSTPQPNGSHSIFASTQRRSHFAPAPDGPAPPMTHQSQAAALSPEEQENARRLGFGEGLLAVSSRRTLQAHVLQQEVRNAKVTSV